MPTNAGQDLNYQPKVDSYNYNQPKPLLPIRLLSPLIDFLLKNEKIEIIFLTLLSVVVSLILVINYFNIFPLSSLYPNIFSALPHKYDQATYSSVLKNLPYLSEVNGYRLNGRVYKIDNGLIYIDYNGKVLEFLTDPKLICSARLTNTLASGKKESIYEARLCSDILNKKSNGLNVGITFYKNSLGYYVISSLYVE